MVSLNISVFSRTSKTFNTVLEELCAPMIYHQGEETLTNVWLLIATLAICFIMRKSISNMLYHLCFMIMHVCTYPKSAIPPLMCVCIVINFASARTICTSFLVVMVVVTLRRWTQKLYYRPVRYFKNVHVITANKNTTLTSMEDLSFCIKRFDTVETAMAGMVEYTDLVIATTILDFIRVQIIKLTLSTPLSVVYRPITEGHILISQINLVEEWLVKVIWYIFGITQWTLEISLPIKTLILFWKGGMLNSRVDHVIGFLSTIPVEGLVARRLRLALYSVLQSNTKRIADYLVIGQQMLGLEFIKSMSTWHLVLGMFNWPLSLSGVICVISTHAFLTGWNGRRVADGTFKMDDTQRNAAIMLAWQYPKQSGFFVSTILLLTYMTDGFNGVILALLQSSLITLSSRFSLYAMDFATEMAGFIKRLRMNVGSSRQNGREMSTCKLTKADLRLLCYGSRGDHLPLKYCAKVLRKYGIDVLDCTFIDIETGTDDLNAIERGRPLVPLHRLTSMRKMAEMCNRAGCPTLSSNFGVTATCNNIRFCMYDPTLMYSPTVGSEIVDLMNSTVNAREDIPTYFNTSFGALPFSADGERVLRPSLFNLFKRILQGKSIKLSVKSIEEVNLAEIAESAIIATGSSKNLIPLPLELLNTDIHTSSTAWLKESNGRRITDSDHTKVFQKYKWVICHGGAGTVRTALAQGCNVVSVDTLLDRQPLGVDTVALATGADGCLAAAVITENPAFAIDELMRVQNPSGILFLLKGLFWLPWQIGVLRLIKTLTLLACILIKTLALVRYSLAALVGLSDLGLIGISTVNSAIPHSLELFRNMFPSLEISVFISRLGVTVMEDLNYSTLISVIANLTSGVGWNATSPFIDCLAICVPKGAENSTPKNVEIWTNPVLKIWDHAFIRSGDEWFQFILDTTCKGSPLQPVMYLEVQKSQPNDKEYCVYDTGIPANHFPEPDRIKDFMRPRNYSASTNCLTGTLALLKLCHTRSIWAELLLMAKITKATPILGLTFALQLYTREFWWDSYYQATGLGDTPTRVNMIIRKIEARILLTDEEVAYMMLEKYSIRPHEAKVTYKKEKSIDKAYFNSTLSQNFKYQKMFAKFYGKLSTDEYKTHKQATYDLLESAMQELSKEPFKGVGTTAVRVRPHIIIQSVKSWTRDVDSIILNLHRENAMPLVMNDMAAFKGWLSQANAKRGNAAGDFNWLVTPRGNSGSTPVTAIESVIGRSTLGPGVKPTDFPGMCVAVALATGMNVTIYDQIRDSKNNNTPTAVRICSSGETGLVFQGSIRLLHSKGNWAIVSHMNIGYDLEDITPAEEIVQLSQHQTVLNWRELENVVWAKMPRTIRSLFSRDDELNHQVRYYVSSAVQNFWTLVERAVILTAHVTMQVLTFTGRIGSDDSTNGYRIKPSNPTSATTNFTNRQFKALEELGLSPLIRAPHWLVESEEPDVLVEPRVMETAYGAWEAEDIVVNHMNKCRIVLATIDPEVKLNTQYRRKFNSFAHSDKYISKRRDMAIKLMGAEIGVDNISYATEDATRISLQRYQKTSLTHEVTQKDIDEYTTEIHRQNLPEYKNFRLWSPERALKDIKRKMNLGYGFEGAKLEVNGRLKTMRKRRDLIGNREMRAMLIKLVQEDLKSSYLDPIVHSAFPKAYKNFREKLEGHPEKVRTIVAPDLFSLVADACIFKSTDLEMKKNWKTSATAIGLPWKATAINQNLLELPEGNQHLVCDMQDYDSMHPGYTPELLASLYAPGFDTLSVDDQKIVKSQIKARWERLQSGGIIYDLNHGQLIKKVRGSTTGSVSVTRPNTELGRFAMAKAISAIWGVSITEAMSKIHMNTMGDDAMISLTGPPVDPDELRATVKSICGLKLTIEFNSVRTLSGPPTWEDAEYLSHKIQPSTKYQEELKKAGITPDSVAWPTYCIVYDPDKLAMRQTLLLRGQTPFTAYDSLRSFMSKAIHHPNHHQALSLMARELIPDILKRRNGIKFLNKRPLLSYEEELRLFYTKLYKEKIYANPYVNRKLTAWVAFVNVVTATVSFTSWMRAIGLYTLASPRIPGVTAALLPTRSYCVEYFAYYSHLELYNREPDYNTFLRLCNVNPFAGLCEPELAWRQFTIPKERATEHAIRERVFYTKYQWLSVLYILVRFVVVKAVRVNIVLGWLNEVYTVFFGMPQQWWGIASELGILADNAPSSKISSAIPKDPFRMSKAITQILLECLPNEILIIGAPRWLFQQIHLILHKLIDITIFDDPTSNVSAGLSSIPETDTWRVEYDTLIRPRILSNIPCGLHAPTGSGKSQTLGKLLREDFRKVVYVVPRVTAAETMRGFRRLTSSDNWPTEDGLYVMTGGHALYRKWKDSMFSHHNTIFIIDEYDDQDAPSLIFCDLLRWEKANYCLLSATQDKKILELFVNEEDILQLKVQPKYEVKMFVAEPYSTLLSLGIANYATHKRILVIEPSVAAGTDLKEKFEACDFDVGTFFAGEKIPDNKLIITSQAGEKSVTIPGIDLVIDSGTMIRQHNGELVKRVIDCQTMSQRAGRTGRTCAGTYITLQNPTSKRCNTLPTAELAICFQASARRLWGLPIEIIPTVPSHNLTNLHGTIGVIRQPFFPEYTDNSIIEFIAATILNSNTAEAADNNLLNLIYSILNPSTEWLMTHHGAAIIKLGQAGLGELRERMKTYWNLDVFSITNNNAELSGPTLRVTTQGIVAFHGNVGLIDETRRQRRIYNEHTFRPIGENLPEEVSLIKSPTVKSNNDNWRLHLIDLLAYFLYGEILTENDNGRRATVIEVFTLPPQAADLNNWAEVLNIVQIICTNLRCSVTLLDCTLVHRRWLDIGPDWLTTTNRIFLVWTKTGGLWFGKTSILYPIRETLTLKLKMTSEQINAHNEHTSYPRVAGSPQGTGEVVMIASTPIKPKGEALAINKDSEVNNCAFRAVAWLLQDFVNPDTRVQENINRELQAWFGVRITPGNSPSVNTFVKHLTDAHASLRDRNGLTDVAELWAAATEQPDLIQLQSMVSHNITYLTLDGQVAGLTRMMHIDTNSQKEYLDGENWLASTISITDYTNTPFNAIEDYYINGKGTRKTVQGESGYLLVGLIQTENNHCSYWRYSGNHQQWYNPDTGEYITRPQGLISLALSERYDAEAKPSEEVKLEDFANGWGLDEFLPTMLFTDTLLPMSEGYLHNNTDELSIYRSKKENTSCFDQCILNIEENVIKTSRMEAPPLRSYAVHESLLLETREQILKALNLYTRKYTSHGVGLIRLTAINHVLEYEMKALDDQGGSIYWIGTHSYHHFNLSKGLKLEGRVIQPQSIVVAEVSVNTSAKTTGRVFKLPDRNNDISLKTTTTLNLSKLKTLVAASLPKSGSQLSWIYARSNRLLELLGSHHHYNKTELCDVCKHFLLYLAASNQHIIVISPCQSKAIVLNAQDSVAVCYQFELHNPFSHKINVCEIYI